MTTTLRLAEACERAIAYAQYAATAFLDESAPEDVLKMREIAIDDTDTFRALAAALRGAIPMGRIEGHIQQVAITLRDA